MSPASSIFEFARDVLTTAGPQAKADRAREVVMLWQDGACSTVATDRAVPARPARPDRPALVSPAKMPRRRLGSLNGRVALLHAVAHIEFNAIDLAFDMVARFGPGIPVCHQNDFISDWLKVGDDEARHFFLVRTRLQNLGTEYGDLPAHDGLWEAAQSTMDDVLARLAVAPLVLEARGLDVTPQMIENLERTGDSDSAGVLRTIYEDEIGHVGIGAKWLKCLAREQGYDPVERFHHYVKTRFNGTLKEPFNHQARARAGFERDFYVNITN